MIGVLLAGQTQRYVGRHFNVSHIVVGRVWQRYLDTGSVAERTINGCPRKTTDSDDRYIVGIARRRQFKSAQSPNANLDEFVSVSKL